VILHHYRHAGTVAFPDEIVVDFDRLPAVVGVRGKNGSGKTTFLDTLVAAFYLQMPYRPEPLHAQFATRGYIDVIWSREPGGKRYRSRINVDPEAGRTEAVLYPAEGGPALAGPLQRNYLAEIGKLLGPLDLFLCSAYTTQQSYTSGKNALTFLLADRAARRGVMADLLGLSSFGMWQAGVKDKIKATETRLNGLQSLARQWESELARRPGTEDLVASVNRRLAEATVVLERAQADHQEAQVALQEAREAKKALIPHQQQHDVLVAEITRLRRRETALAAEIAAAQEAIARANRAAHAPAEREKLLGEIAGLAPAETQLPGVEAELLEIETELEGVIRDANADTALLARRAEIEAAVEEIRGLDQELEQAAGAYDVQMTADSAALSAYRDWLVQKMAWQQEARALAADQEAAATIETVPCGGSGDFARCRFLVNADAARTRLPEATARVTQLQADVGEDRTEPVPLAPQLKARIEQLKASRAALGALAAKSVALEMARTRVDGLHDRADALNRRREDKRTRRTDLAAEVARLKPLRTALEILTPLVAVARTLEAHLATAQAKDQEIVVLREELVERSGRLAVADAALADLPKITAAVVGGDTAVLRGAAAVREAQTIVTTLTRESGVVQMKLQALDEVQVRLDDARTQIGPLQTDLDDWTLLNKALSPAGIPALLVDQALPEISALATDMLRDCLGEALFTIQLVTQKPSADDKKVLEVLDVLIYRDGTPMKVENLSGGEGVLVSEAISLAIALINARRAESTRSYTLFRDEVGANLDVDRAPAYTRLLARAVKLGGFDRVVFVSHHVAALDLAEAQVEIRDGALAAA